jgi:dihydrolipoamide dehydrogenase
MERSFYDVVVIGGGPAGYSAALKLSENKLSVCLVDFSETRIGGTCLNEGCIPVKSLAESAHLQHQIKRSASFGLEAEVRPVEWKKLTQSAENNKKQLREGILFLLKKNEVKLLSGKAKFLSANSIVVESESESQEIEAKGIVVASGSIAKEISAFPFNGRNILSSKEILALEKLPESLLIIGGGAIGCEFASIFKQFGVETTLVEIAPRLLPDEDEDISRALKRELEKSGITIMTESAVKALMDQGDFVEAVLQPSDEAESKKVLFECALVAAGRVPNTANLGLEKIGLDLKNGFITVNGNFQTAIPSIFAAGDVIQTPMVAHAAYREGVLAAENCALIIFEKKTSKNSIDYDFIPRIVFSTPQVGAIGMTERWAKEQNREIKVLKSFFKANGKALIQKEEAGFVKIIYDSSDGRILGGSIIGPSATELINEIGLAASAGLSVKQLGNFIHGHPTLSEAIGESI